MLELKLLDFKAESIEFLNDVVVPEEIETLDVQIGTAVSSEVNYSSDNTKCKCTTTVKIFPENIDVDFKATIRLVGVFECAVIDDRKSMHVAVCNTMFPRVQSFVSSFMTVAGFPNFIVEDPCVNAEDVEVNS